jgi:hypothetical protein
MTVRTPSSPLCASELTDGCSRLGQAGRGREQVRSPRRGLRARDDRALCGLRHWLRRQRGACSYASDSEGVGQLHTCKNRCGFGTNGQTHPRHTRRLV